ncbi:MAG: tetratricopeptide repeat protein [Acidobacteria bacterium]|nr:tetratricopeptide repeat protein [Acidobacteriota bacterium]
MPRKLALVGVAALATLALALPLSAHFRAAYHADFGTREHVIKAIELTPRNAELHNRLGRLLLYSPLGNPHQAVRELQLATQLDPRTGQYWVDLATASEIAGDLRGAEAAVARARAAEPNTPAILWHEANFLVRRGQDQKALERLKVLLAGSPEYTVLALAFFAHVAEAGVLIEQAVPHERQALEAAMEFVRREEQVSSAARLWKAVSQLKEPPAESQLKRFVDWLIAEKQVPLALAVWNESAKRGWLAVDPTVTTDSVYNADFQKPLQNFGFDWRVLPHADASAWIEARGPAPGLPSLCIQFSDESRSEYAHALQAVPVEPNTHYILHASLRSDRLVSRSGAALAITTPENNQPATRTDSVTGTSHWREVIARFDTSAQANLAYIRLIRPAPAKDDEPASGMVCLADIRWRKLGSLSTEVSLRR